MLTLIAKIFDRAITFPLSEDTAEFKAGSMPENRIYLPYRGVSRHHFTVLRNGTEWSLKDEGSTNGTLLNGKKIQIAPLTSGDIIQVGMIEIQVFEEDSKSAPILLPDVDALNAQAKTDRVLPKNEKQEQSDIFFFPKFLFPDGFQPGKSPALLNIYQKLHSLVESDVNILFIGETGTGKEMFARTMHLSGKRASGPFMALNCAAIPAELMESELFGIGEKVATDVNRRIGKFAAANGGILFLDELEAFPVSLQAKILRAVEEKAYTPVGETQPKHSDFRVLSATNQDPQELIQSGKLREDLYHRLAMVEIRLPPLREQKEGLTELILTMLARVAQEEGKRFAGISQELMNLLLHYSYPGNIRELKNILRAIVALGHSGEMLDVHLIPEKLLQSSSSPNTFEEIIQQNLAKDSLDFHDFTSQVSKKFVESVLERNQGNVRKAAEQMKISEFGLRKLMKRLGIPKS